MTINLMLLTIQIIAAIIAIVCAIYLLLSPVERDALFHHHQLGELLFPKLCRDERQRRLSLYVGTILFVIIIASSTAFIVKLSAPQLAR